MELRWTWFIVLLTFTSVLSGSCHAFAGLADLGEQRSAVEKVPLRNATSDAEKMVHWKPIIDKFAGTYERACTSSEDATPNKAKIVISPDGKITSGATRADLKKLNFVMSLETGAEGTASWAFSALQDDFALRVTSDQTNMGVVRVSKGFSGTACPITLKGEKINSPKLFSIFSKLIDIQGKIICTVISDPQKRRTLDYRIDKGILTVFDEIYDLKNMKAELVSTDIESGGFMYKAVADDGRSVSISNRHGRLEGVYALKKNGDGFNC